MPTRGTLIVIGLVMTLLIVPLFGFFATVLVYHLNPNLPPLNKKEKSVGGSVIDTIVGVLAIAIVVAVVLAALFAVIYFPVVLRNTQQPVLNQ